MFKSWRIGNGTLVRGDCEEVLKWCAPNSFSAMITDPPYGLSFMGKRWDYDVPKRELWERCLNVLKPGAHALIFAGSRTQHRMAVNVEDAGFVLKDCLEYLHELRWSDFYKTLDREQRKMFLNLSDESKLFWLYGSGFPKSTDISKQIDKMKGAEREVVGSADRKASLGSQATYGNSKFSEVPDITAPATPEAELWNGWKTHLKPAYEPILLAMKSNNGSYAANALKHGVAGLNIDDGRIAGPKPSTIRGAGGQNGRYRPLGSQGEIIDDGKGRYPANVIFDEEAARMLDEQAGVRKSGARIGREAANSKTHGSCYGKFAGYTDAGNPASSGGASRFFYCAKTSRSERGGYNKHPTVKPIKLMEYLCKLVSSPAETTILDPFAGSGTTALACEKLGLPWFAIEREPEYIETIIRRFMEWS